MSVVFVECSRCHLSYLHGEAHTCRPVVEPPRETPVDTFLRRVKREELGTHLTRVEALDLRDSITALRSALSAAQRTECERFEAQGWNVGSIEEACAELDRLCAQTREAEVRRLAAESALSSAQRDSERLAILVEVVRLIGKSGWDAPGWNLHVSRDKAELLFDVAYDNPAGPRPLDSNETRELRKRFLAGGSTPRTTEP